MTALEKFVHAIDAINDAIGRFVAWLVLGVVVICFAVVVLRYGFNWGDIRLQEGYVWLHAIVFMMGAGYTLKDNGHVRVDVFYSKMTARAKAWVNIFGTLVFLLPWLAVIVIYGWPYVSSSWALLEPSSEPGGIPAYFLLKSVIYGFCAVTGIQALAMIARSVLVLQGREEYSIEGGGH